ncbi:outer membrane protein [Loktanella agnita]|uniref:outer membrane protein n=1 Tax=Loktanella agnita TaxID=287097 RepID=UPI00398A0876
MKSIIGTTAILAAMTAASAANAQGMSGDWYVSVFAGFSMMSDAEYDATDNYAGYDEVIFATELEAGPLIGIAVGTEISPNLRAEAELSYATYELGESSVDYSYPGGSGSYSYGDTDGDASATYILANLWYDLPNMGGGTYVPYIGGGIGGVQVEAEDSDDTVAAGQIGAGAQFALGSGFLDVGYRLKVTGELDFASKIEPLVSHNLQAGYVMKF